MEIIGDGHGELGRERRVKSREPETCGSDVRPEDRLALRLLTLDSSLSTFILHRFDFDPRLEFAARGEAASGKFAGDVYAEDRAVSGGGERAVEDPLAVA